MKIDMDPLEAIIAAGSTKSYYEKVTKHYRERGVPDFMKDTVEHHLDSTLSAHQKMIAVLREEGYLMRDDDIEPVDHKELMKIEWIPPQQV